MSCLYFLSSGSTWCHNTTQCFPWHPRPFRIQPLTLQPPRPCSRPTSHLAPLCFPASVPLHMLFLLPVVAFHSLVGKLLHIFKPPAQTLFLCEAPPGVAWQRDWAPPTPPAHLHCSTWHVLLASASVPAVPSTLLRDTLHVEIPFPHSHAQWIQRFPKHHFPLLLAMYTNIFYYSLFCFFFKKNMLVHPLNSFCYSLKNTALEPPVGRQGLCL